MGTQMPSSLRHAPAVTVWACVLLCGAGALIALPLPATAQTPATPSAAASAPPPNSAMDDRLFYQLLVGEMALGAGDAGSAYELLLDAARRSRDEGLFRRTVDIAMRSRAGDQALAASRAWRLARPESADAARMQLQILLLLNRPEAVGDPLRALLSLTPVTERGELITELPRFLQRAGEPRTVVTLMEEALAPYRDAKATRVASRVALGRAWLQAGEPGRALALAREAQTLEPLAPGPALLGMEMMRGQPEAEGLVRAYLAQEKAEPALRLAYVRVLTGALAGRMMAAFSAAMASSVSPRMAVWSKPTPVMTATLGFTTLVASQRPPRPTSSTANSTRRSRNSHRAAAVSSSNSVKPPAEPVGSSGRSLPAAASAASIASAKSASLTGTPSSSMRSL